MKSVLLKRILHWTGSILSIVGVVFVAIKLSEYGGQIAFSRFTFGSLLSLFGLAVVYATANVLLALAWKTLLQHLGIDVNFVWAIRTYGVSQLARYVPGNIFHLAGRQAIGQAAGLPAWPLAKSTVWELGLISFTGAMFGVFALPHFVPMVSIPLAAVAFVCVMGVMLVVLSKYIGPLIARAVGLYAAFLAFSGLIFVVMLMLFVAEYTIPPLQTISICGTFVVAWLAGLLTPGAPAGIGVRELVLVVLLKGIVPEAELLLAVLLSRLVTVGGDFLFYLVALFVPTEPITGISATNDKDFVSDKS
jgi:uncharacterized membrane protein YbhN (UPF0104 family)